MELFTVNRYTEEDFKTKPAEAEDQILEKLLQKAEKRKRKQKKDKVEEPSQESAEHQTINEDVPQTLETRKRRQKDDNADSAFQEPESDQPLEQQEAADSDKPADASFEVIGEDVGATKRQKVEMVLPSWLAHPTIIPGDSLKRDEDATADTDEAALKNQPYLDKPTRDALKQMKIKRLFPVQRSVIPWILDAHSKPAPFRPRDICVSAPTGSGKTLAFAIPIVQLLMNRVKCKVRALVVLPVAELAMQVYKVIASLCNKTELEVCLLSKQHRLEAEQEALVELYKGEYYSKVDIVVTTPGRLVDHLHATKGFCLKELKFLVIDEADRIMDAVFQNWLYHLDSHVRDTADQLLAGRTAPLCLAELRESYGKKPHKMLFSATLSQDPEKLQNLRLFQPKLFTTVLIPAPTTLEPNASALVSTQTEERGQFIGKYTTPAELTEQYCITEPRLKPLTLFALIKQNNWQRFLCFTNSNDTSTRLAFVLSQLKEKGEDTIAELSANLSAAKRRATLDALMRGKLQGIICSDALARGIDVSNIDIVVSYDVPRHIKTYIHRVGRTARAGRPGTAITLLTPKDQPQFRKMLSEVGKPVGEEITVDTEVETGYAHLYHTALETLRKTLEATKKREIVSKTRNTQAAAKLHKDPSQLTLMEKLQQVTGVHTSKPKPKEPKSHLKMPKNKLKPNASQRKIVEE
ncbi:probable ATP-dependent RNA helicase Dbp73D [Scaptodrosophila lebanonensis]|uniref:ATP-dependent RNA helicase n=1 Tax=Drosophila lebanonensis TaxID=7225 RepID=A0A6J2UDL5_DROLE|nr:probable ATP-dependent RNA helicase Dbp73D [Scaptodrosophila lebanonensis]